MTNTIEICGKTYIVLTPDELEQKLSDSYHAGAWNERVRNRKTGRNGIYCG